MLTSIVTVGNEGLNGSAFFTTELTPEQVIDKLKGHFKGVDKTGFTFGNGGGVMVGPFPGQPQPEPVEVFVCEESDLEILAKIKAILDA